MQPLIVRDTVPLTGVRTTSDGRLLAEPRFARTGIQIYGGNEVGIPDKATVRLYRSPEAVFDKAAMASFAHRAVTNDHPPGGVSIDNFKDEVVGFTGDTVTKDGDFVRIPMMLSDRATIEAVNAGKVELSAGYTCLVDWTPGVTPQGEAFDGQMKNLRGNHVAIVDRARGGASLRIGDEESRSECRVGDAADAAPTTPNNPPTTRGERAVPDDTRAVVLDGLTIRTNDAGAEAIARLQRQITDATAIADAAKAEAQRVADGLRGQIAALTASHTEALQAKDGEVAALKATHAEALAAKDGELVATKALIPDAAAFDAALASRQACADEAGRVYGDGFDPRGKTEAEMRRIAVAKRLGDAVVTPMSDAEVGGAFRALAASAAPAAKPDPLRTAIASGPAPVADAAPQVKAFDSYLNRLQNSWKHADAKGAV